MIRLAILDLYEGKPNQGMRCIRDIIKEWSKNNDLEVLVDEYEVRLNNQLPDLNYDIYISSGGPGSPLESKDTFWDAAWEQWLRSVEEWNNHPGNHSKKNVFFICHSFQLACRYYGIAHITRRKSTAFGVFPVHVVPEGQVDPVFYGLKDPFYVVDSRDWQVIDPDFQKLEIMGAKILCIEKYRPHVPYVQAVMGIRFNEFMLGTQFHPEADAQGMSMYLQTEEKKEIVIETHGEEKWKSMIEQLNDPDKIMWTYTHILPNFLTEATKQLHQQLEPQ